MYVGVVVINKAELGIVNFRRPLERLIRSGRGRNSPERSIAVVLGKVSGRIKEFADVLGDVVPVRVPSPPFLNRKRTRRNRLGRIPYTPLNTFSDSLESRNCNTQISFVPRVLPNACHGFGFSVQKTKELE